MITPPPNYQPEACTCRAGGKHLVRTSRNQSIDWIAGLLTLVVIVQHIDDLSGHSFWWDESGLGKVFYFYMPWFFFKSGTFEKDRPVRVTYRKVWSSLVVPYLFFSVLSWVLWAPGYLASLNWSLNWLLGATFMRFYQLGYIPNDGPIWFLIALIICRLIYPVAKRYLRNNYAIAAVGWLLAAVYYAIYHSVDNAQWVFIALPQGFMGLSIYALGAQLRVVQYRRQVYLVAVAVYLSAFCFSGVTMNFSRAGLNSQWYAWLTALPLWIAGVIACNNLIGRMPRWFFRICNLGYIGRNAMTYYCGHFIILTTLVYFYEEMGLTLSGMPLAWAMALSCMVILPLADKLLRRYLPWAVGGRGTAGKKHDIGAVADPMP